MPDNSQIHYHSIMENMVLHLDDEELKNTINSLFNEKLEQIKKETIDEIFFGELNESSGGVIKQGRTKIIRIRIRNGKVQRRKKFSSVKGYTIRGGKLVRMSQREKTRRRLAAKRAKLKRRAKMRQILRKRKLSLRRRKVLGL